MSVDFYCSKIQVSLNMSSAACYLVETEIAATVKREINGNRRLFVRVNHDSNPEMKIKNEVGDLFGINNKYLRLILDPLLAHMPYGLGLCILFFRYLYGLSCCEIPEKIFKFTYWELFQKIVGEIYVCSFASSPRWILYCSM